MEQSTNIEKTYSIAEVAKLLNRAENTIRKYEEDYNLHIKRDEMDRRAYTEDDLEMLRLICTMKNQGANIHTIRKVLNRNPEALAYKEKNIESANVRDLNGAELMQLFKAAVVEVATNLQEQHEKSINELKEHFDMQMESMREEIKAEMEAQTDQQKQENAKLMEYLGKVRAEEQEKNNKGILGRIKSLISKK